MQRIKSKFRSPSEDFLNDHSKVIYLMGPDNKFLAFYDLEIDERELVTQIIEELGQDISQRFLGTGMKPQYIENDDWKI